jgi:hypothetical protein
VSAVVSNRCPRCLCVCVCVCVIRGMVVWKVKRTNDLDTTLTGGIKFESTLLVELRSVDGTWRDDMGEY